MVFTNHIRPWPHTSTAAISSIAEKCMKYGIALDYEARLWYEYFSKFLFLTYCNANFHLCYVKVQG